MGARALPVTGSLNGLAPAWFLARTQYQFLVTVPQGQAYGWTVVWEDDNWVLWKIPPFNEVPRT